MNELAEKVRAFNATLNDGRGSQVLRNAIMYLEMGDLVSAQHCIRTDTDKLTQYPGVIRFCAENGLLSDEYLATIKKYLPQWLES